MRFEDLGIDKRIVEILNINRLTSPTVIQSQTYKMAANGVDIIGVSKTGSGKTLAFLLPILNQVVTSDKPFHTLIITPTRELGLQISDCISLFESLGIRHAALVGGEIFSSQIPALNKHPHIVVGTPGRIVRHIVKTKNFKIGSVRKLVLDEADRFFDQDFSEDLGVIASRLARKNQALMFTATLTEKTESLSNIFMRSPKIIEATAKYERVETLQDCLAFVPEKHKLAVLCNYLLQEAFPSVIVFSAMCRDAQKLGELLRRIGLTSECLHGHMPQPSREGVIRAFRKAQFSILVATDVASRGLDIPDVGLVVNYDLPNTAKDYTHRVGRTARAGRDGRAVSFVTQYDVYNLQRLEHVLGRKLQPVELPLYDDSTHFLELYEQVCTDLSDTDRLVKRR